jgi:hypothetical protein
VVRPGRCALVLAAAAVAGTAAVYLPVVDIGLYWDDYHLVRPWTPIELRRVWYGSWDPTGIEALFFRPLTAWLYAARFELFGLNTWAMHAASLAGHALCAWLVGIFLQRERAGTATAVLGTLIYAAHPSLPYAQTSWLTNQMHLAGSLVFIAALLCAQRSTVQGWAGVGLCAIAAFLIKEDGAMLVPAIAAVTLLRRWLLGQALPRGWPWLALSGIVLVGALMLLRYERLGQLGGYGGVPAFEQATTNYLRGLKATLALWPSTRVWQAVSAAMALAAALWASVGAWRRNTPIAVAGFGTALLLVLPILPVLDPATHLVSPWAPQGIASGIALGGLVAGGILAASRVNRLALFLLAGGVAVAAIVGLPYMLVTKREQYYALALAGALTSTGAAHAVLSLAAPSRRRTWLAALLGIVLVPHVLLARHHTKDFEPCAPPVLAGDDAVAGWWPVPTEVKQWLEQKRARCRQEEEPGSLTALRSASWGMYEPEAGGEPFRWTSDRAAVLTSIDASQADLQFRRPGASPSAPVLVTIDTGRERRQVRLESADWTRIVAPLPDGGWQAFRSWLRQAHRIDVTVEPFFVPALIDPQSRDVRRRGVQMQAEIR